VEWLVSDGTRVTWEGGEVRVEGASALAAALRGDLAAARAGYPREVSIAPPPGGGLPFDPSNVWMIDRWVREEASRPSLRQALSVSSSYVPRDDEAPPRARKLLARYNGGPPGVIF